MTTAPAPVIDIAPFFSGTAAERTRTHSPGADPDRAAFTQLPAERRRDRGAHGRATIVARA